MTLVGLVLYSHSSIASDPATPFFTKRGINANSTKEGTITQTQQPVYREKTTSKVLKPQNQIQSTTDKPFLLEMSTVLLLHNWVNNRKSVKTE